MTNPTRRLDVLWHVILVFLGATLAYSAWDMSVPRGASDIALRVVGILVMLWMIGDLAFAKNRPASARRAVFLIIMGAATFSSLRLLAGCDAQDSSMSTRVVVTANQRYVDPACQAGEPIITLGVNLAPPSVDGWNLPCRVAGDSVECTKAVTEDIGAVGIIDLGRGDVFLSFGPCRWEYDIVGMEWE